MDLHGFELLPDELLRIILEYVAGLTFDEARKSSGSSNTTKPQFSAAVYSLIAQRVCRRFKLACAPLLQYTMETLSSERQDRARQLAAHFSMPLSIRLRNAWFESWTIGDEERYYTASISLSIFNSAGYKSIVKALMPTEEEKARGLSTHFAYDRPRLSVILHYRLLAKNISSTYCDTFSQAKCIIIATDEPEDGQFCEQFWYACVHRHVGRCNSSRSSLRALWARAANWAEVEFYFSIIDASGHQIINNNGGLNYRMTVDGVPGYIDNGTKKHQLYPPCV